MTKTNEIALLDTAIKSFGPHSYLGPWLADIRHGLVADITNDLTPHAPLPNAARAEALAMLTEATAEATRIRTEATAWATAEKARAREAADRIRQDARASLQRIVGQF